MNNPIIDILIPERTNAIPFEKAAGYFVNLKLASGGLLTAEVDLLKAAMASTLTPEDYQRAADQGSLAGVRSSVAQDIARSTKLQRTSGERVGKEVGTGVGALAGLMVGKSIGERALHAGVGALIGRGGGKIIGAQRDQSRLAPKTGEIAKEGAVGMRELLQATSGLRSHIDPDQVRDAALSGGISGGGEQALEDTLSTAGGLAGSALRGKYRIPGIVLGNLSGKHLAHQLSKKAQIGDPNPAEANEQIAEGKPEAEATDEVGQATPAEPVVTVPEDLKPSPLDEILELIQKGNKAEDLEAQLGEAQQAVEDLSTHSEGLESQLGQLSQQHEQLQAEHEQTAQMGEMQSQEAQQQTTMAQQQAMEAQQQLMALQQAFTSFRQELMSLAVQDPAAAVAPTGQPMPGGVPGMPSDVEATAQEQGMPAEAPPAAATAPKAPAQAKPPAAAPAAPAQAQPAAAPKAPTPPGGMA